MHQRHMGYIASVQKQEQEKEQEQEQEHEQEREHYSKVRSADCRRPQSFIKESG